MSRGQGRIDEERRRAFERALASGGDPALEEHLPPAGSPLFRGTLEELVCIELELRWKRWSRDRGGPPPPTLADYQGRFPELGESGVARRLAAEERRLRRSADAPATKRIGRYELGEEIGRGSFARVYRARDLDLGRTVAVKVLRAELVDDERMRARIRREAQSAARLRHPGIVSVYEVGDHEGTPYIVSELVEGPGLDALLADGKAWEPGRAAALVARIAEALDYAHRLGIVHRDVKPANVLLGPEGRPMVTDFGLALHLDAEASLTREGDVLGTPAFMSPEQVRGAADVDARTDVYGLGVFLYHTLCGRLPFEGSWHSVLRQVVEEDPPRPRRRVPSVPADLETVCLKAMAKDPERRYASAAELAADLWRFLRREPIRARRAGPGERLVLWCRRNPRLALTLVGASLAVACVALVGLRGVLVERDRFRRERDASQANLHRALVGEARALVRARGTGWRWRALENARQAATLDEAAADRSELRRLAIEVLGCREPSFRLHEEWSVDGGAARVVAFGPRTELAAAGCADGSIELRGIGKGGPAVRLLGHTDAVTGLAFRPGASPAPTDVLLASTSLDGTLRFWRIGEAPEALGTLAPGAGALHGLAVGASGTSLALACEDGRVALLDAWSADAEPRFLGGHTDAVTDVVFSPSGELLASCSRDVTARVWDLASGAAVEVLDVQDPPSAVTFDSRGRLYHASPATYGFSRYTLGGSTARAHRQLVHAGGVTRLAHRGRWLVTASSDGGMKVWNRSLETIAAVDPGRAPIRGLGAGPDGRWLLTGHEDGAVRLWELAEPACRTFVPTQHSAAFRGARELVVPGALHRLGEGLARSTEPFWPAGVRCLGIRPGGEGFAFGRKDGTLSLAAPDGHPRRTWRGHEDELTCLAIRPDGRLWATGSTSGEVRVWDWEDGAPVAALPAAASCGEVRRLSWAPDGEALLVSGDGGTSLWTVGGPPPAEAVLPHVQEAVFAGPLVAAATARGAIELFDPETWERERVLVAHEGAVTGLATFRDGGRLVTGAADGTILVWDAGLRSPALQLAAGFAPTWFAPSPGEAYLLAGSRTGSRTELWDLASGHRRAWLTFSVTCAAYSGDETALLGTPAGSVLVLPIPDIERRVARATGGARDPLPDAIRITDFETLVPGGHDTRVWGVAASPDGRWIATSAHDGTVKLWEASRAEGVRLVWSREAHDGPAWSVAFDSASERLVSTSLDVAAWSVPGGDELVRLPVREKLSTSAVFLDGSPGLATGSLDGSVLLWDLELGREAGALHRGDEMIHQLALDPGGRWLAAASHAGVVLVWDLSGGGEGARPAARVLGDGASPVWAVGFREDGRVLAAGDEEGTITLWGLPGWEEVARMHAELPLLRSVAFDASGELVAAGSIRAQAVVWDLPAVERALAELGLGR